jgi:hypothetical protein
METELKATLSNYCQCQNCSDCGIFFIGDYAENCPECNQAPDPIHDSCTGECWEEQKELFYQLFETWEQANGEPEYCYIEGSGMGWLRKAGHTAKLEGWEQVLEALTGDFDFTLRCKFDPTDNSLTIVRSSHDEFGALFTVQSCETCYYCGDGMTYDEVECKWTDLSGDTQCFYTEFGHFPNELLPE